MQQDSLTLEEAEATLRRCLTPVAADVSALVDGWRPSFRFGKEAAGNGLVARLRERGIESCVPLRLPHSELVTLARGAARAVEPRAVAGAFVRACNPADRANIVWCSPLRSLSILRQLPDHGFEGANDEVSQCRICGEPRVGRWWPVGLAQELPWGVLGEDWEVLRNAMYLRWLTTVQLPTPAPDDWAAMTRMFEVIAEAPPTSTVNQLAKRLKRAFKGMPDWGKHLEALAFAGVLRADRHPGNLQRWVRFVDRQEVRRETPPPASFWRRHMGVDTAVCRELFPELTLPEGLSSPQPSARR